MAISYNRVYLMGYIGGDPHITETVAGALRARFSLATHRSEVSSQEERRERTDWHQIIAWGKLAERCEAMLSKGRLVFITGRLETRKWTTEDGQQHTRVYVVARELLVLDRRPEASSQRSRDDQDVQQDQERGDDDEGRASGSGGIQGEAERVGRAAEERKVRSSDRTEGRPVQLR